MLCGNPVWGPFYIQDQRIVESIQRRATRLVPGIRHLTYADHLSILNIPSLLYRRKCGDMITLYQIFHGLVDLELLDFFSLSSYSSTRGHSRKLYKSRSSCRARSKFFSIRVINDWNSLPERIINAPSISNFKNLLDCYWNNYLYSNDF